MSALCKLVPAWGWAVLVSAVLLGVQQIRLLSAQSAASQAQAELFNYRAEVGERDRRAALAVLAENQRRQAAVEENRRRSNEALGRAKADAVAADRIAGGLRAELTRIRGIVANYSGATGGSQAGRSTTDLLANLLEEVEREGRAMAAEADRRGVAGAMCERVYDGVRGQLGH